jgi:hypothetical protein
MTPKLVSSIFYNTSERAFAIMEKKVEGRANAERIYFAMYAS